MTATQAIEFAVSVLAKRKILTVKRLKDARDALVHIDFYTPAQSAYVRQLLSEINRDLKGK